MTILPVTGLLTVLSGLWLYWHASAGFDSAYMGSRPGMVYGLGMILTVAALLIGILVVRPAIARSATAEPALAQQLRQRAGTGARVVALMVGIAVTCMAVGRYV